MRNPRKDSAPAWVPPLFGAMMLTLAARVFVLGLNPLTAFALAAFAIAVVSGALTWRWD